MRKYALGVCALLLAFMLGPPGKLWANTVSMQLTGVSQSLGNYYVAPYQFSVSGQTAGLICDDASDEVSVGESWTATTETFSNLNPNGTVGGFLFKQGYLDDNSSDTISQFQAYEEAGWLVEQIYANITDTTVAGEYQYALWDVFDPGFSNTSGAGLGSGAQSAVNTDLLNAEEASNYGSSTYSDLVIYTPSTWSKGDGRPQEYFGMSVAMPEPMTLWSLSIVLAAIAAACKWKDRTSVKSATSASV